MDCSILRWQEAHEIVVGPFLSVTNQTPVTGITTMTGFDYAVLCHVSASDININGDTITEIDATNMPGYYTIDLSAASMCREGLWVLALADASVFLPIRHLCNVTHQLGYDWAFKAAGTDYLRVNIQQMNAAAVAGSGSTADPWD